MKANEAPDKLYIDLFKGEFNVSYSPINNSVEYTRTDAFIEKACEFIKEHHHEFSFWNTEEYELGFSTQKFIEDFKKYMKL